jgi:hypothetical protein
VHGSSRSSLKVPERASLRPHKACVGSERLYGGQPVTLRFQELRRDHGINTLMQAIEATPLNAPIGGGRAHPNRPQVRHIENCVACCRERNHCCIEVRGSCPRRDALGAGAKSSHRGGKAPRPRTSPPSLSPGAKSPPGGEKAPARSAAWRGSADRVVRIDGPAPREGFSPARPASRRASGSCSSSGS